MNTSITTQQIIALQSIINSNPNLKEGKEYLIQDASDGRTTSVKELSFEEAKALITALNMITSPRTVNVDDPCHRMRGKILSHAHELGWHKKDGKGMIVRDRATQKPKIDFDRVNDWCIKFGYLHKKLDRYTYEELPTLVSQFQKVYKNYLNSF